MNNCLCVNLDTEEYLDFANCDNWLQDASAATRTLKYFMATEWAKNRIRFVFENAGKSSLFPYEDDAYEYIKNNYDERALLNRVPNYVYVANIDKKEYYTAGALPEGDDTSYINPLPFLLSEPGTETFEKEKLKETEEADVGRWLNDDVRVLNNANLLKGFRIYESPYVKENELSNVLRGLNIVVTGTFRNFKRTEIEKLISERGGNFQNSVTKRTDVLVIANKPGSKKVADASKHGVKTITERDFLDMIGE